MTTPKLEELTIEQLKKKDKETIRLLIFLSVVYLICLTGYLITKSMLVVSIFPLLITLLPLIKNRKKLKEELKKRA